ncbi:MAG TPA: hypothetical protein VEN81_13830 [Planctomycetota bacterium]|nr:hypothetical protein [Planctomycetota bacterium]
MRRPERLRTRGYVLAWILAWSLAAASGAHAQGITDLVGQTGAGSPSPESGSLDLRFGRDRVDLGLSPNLRSTLGPGKSVVGLSAQADLRMICGHYDLKASLQHLLGREAREEFLEGILETLVHELIGSGMELLCQAEPTLCTLLQNHSVAANLKLGYYKDLCQAIESAVVDGARKSYASTVDQCLKEKKDQGLPLDQAVELCQRKTPQWTGFRGEVLGELDLGKELQGLLQGMGLSSGARKLAGLLADDTRLGPGSVAAELDPGALPRLYDETQAGYAQKLQSILAQKISRGPVGTADLERLVPPGAPPLAQDELGDLALLPPRQQAPVVAALASAWALFELGDGIRELERSLEVLKAAPTVDDPKRRMLEDRLVRLRSEKARLAERVRDQELVMRAVGSARELGAQEAARRVAWVEARTGETGRLRDLGNETRSYGTLPRGPAGTPGSGSSSSLSPSAGACTTCGFDFSLGSVGVGR